MSEAVDSLPLPPGNLGLPLVGETLPFSQGIFEFIDARMARHGPIFKTRVLGKNTIIFAGPAFWPYWLDESLTTRDGGMFPHVLELFGGVSLPSMDGGAHRARKRQVMGAFDRAALETYLPGLERSMSAAFERWSGQEIRGVQELRKLAIEGLALNMLGLEPGQETEAIVAHYLAVTSGLGAVPISLPGTTFSRARQGRDSVLDFLRGVIAQRRQRPTADGLSRMLATADADGATLTDDDAVLELHHVFLAGYIVFAELAGILMQLDAHPELRDALAAEVAGHGPLELVALHRMALLDRFVMEVKRATPVLPLIQARARTTFACEGYRIPQGWQLCVALSHGNKLPAGFRDPERFDPERFGPQRSEHTAVEHAFVPQAGGPIMEHHRCAGQDYSTWFMKVFTALLLRGYTFALPEQELSYDYGLIPPEPASGLRVSFQAR